jgi:Mg/Co/Ni transporter MgtE
MLQERLSVLESSSHDVENPSNDNGFNGPPRHAARNFKRVSRSLKSKLSNFDNENNTHDNHMPFWESVRDRASWLVGLLVFQSCSSFILAQNDQLLQNHPVIVHFLTMLVGAGGNAGNQASIGVIRGLATGALHKRNMRQFLRKELYMAVALTVILSFSGFLRASFLSRTPPAETFAITSSLAMIVFTSICLGDLLPLLLQQLGLQPTAAPRSKW